MLQKIKNYIIIAITVLGFGVPIMAPAVAMAAGAGCNGNSTQLGLAEGISDAAGGANNCNAPAGGGISGLASKVVNVLSIVVGVVAVIMIIIGGFRYITSGGESSNVSGAKNTLIYAIVGLIIVAVAQFIVHYVLNTAATATQ